MLLRREDAHPSRRFFFMHVTRTRAAV